MDLAALFDEPVCSDQKNSLDEELSLIQAGDKAMSVFSAPDKAGKEDFQEIIDLALLKGLTTTRAEFKIPDDDATTTYLFITRINETWRIPVYLETRNILYTYGWSNGAEFLESYILGYREDQIKARMALVEATRLSWTGRTFYILLREGDIAPIVKLGKRCFDPTTFPESAQIFFSRGNATVRSEVATTLPRGMVLARGALLWSLMAKLFRPAITSTESDIVAVSLNRTQIPDFNAALQANLQFLSADGWV